MTTTTNPLDALLSIRDGYFSARWNFSGAIGTPVSSPGGVGDAAAVSFSFPTTAPSYFSGAGFAPFADFQKVAARDALSVFASVARVNFTEVTGIGNMTFAMNTQSSPAYAYFPSHGYTTDGVSISTVSPSNEAGDVWFNSGWGWKARDFAHGEFGFEALLHEIGHAMGLKHPFQSGPNGFTLDQSLDNKAFTVMSYTSHPHGLFRSVTGSDATGYSWNYHQIGPETLMPFDIAALQYLYGANLAYRTGNDTYTFDTDRPFIKTIWDAGGTDTISVSNFSLGCVIDLRAGAYSSIAIPSDPLPAGYIDTNTNLYNGTDNLAIAFGVRIENAVGGGGNDRLIGNPGMNKLDGGAGADSMSGGDGADTYLLRQAGDKVSESNAAAAGGIDMVWSYLASYVLGANVENGRILAIGEAKLTGNALKNTLFAGPGNNTLDGGSGVDTVSYLYAAAAVNASLDTGQAGGGSGTDTLINVENLAGGKYADSLSGNGAVNMLNGGSGNDTLDGGAGNDALLGGLGKDRLAGGLGSDRFDFNSVLETGIGSTARDVITDFSGAQGDRLDLSTIDANTGSAGNQAFTKLSNAAAFSATTSFTAAGQLFFDQGTHLLYGNTDADAAAEFAIELVGVSAVAWTSLVA